MFNGILGALGALVPKTYNSRTLGIRRNGSKFRAQGKRHLVHLSPSGIQLEYGLPEGEAV